MYQTDVIGIYSMVIEISCVEVWREISNYIDETVAPELRDRIEAHFKVCKHCTAVLDGTRNVVKLVADEAEFEVPAGLGSRLYSKLNASLGKT
jgi:anti-sigma factor (TIGR02949 family)